MGGPRTRGAEPPLATIAHPSGMKSGPIRLSHRGQSQGGFVRPGGQWFREPILV
jgi:hypothetical protein